MKFKNKQRFVITLKKKYHYNNYPPNYIQKTIIFNMALNHQNTSKRPVKDRQNRNKRAQSCYNQMIAMIYYKFLVQ